MAACGTIMPHKGEIYMNIGTPVIAVRKFVRHGSHVRMVKHGGYIKNKSSGKRLPYVVRQGVYFIKLKMLDPDDEDDNAKASDVARP